MEGGHQHNYNVNKSLKSVLYRYFKTTTFTTTAIKRHYLALVTQSRTLWVFRLYKIIHVVFDVWYKLGYSISVIAVCSSYICATFIQQENGNTYEQQRFFIFVRKSQDFRVLFSSFYIRCVSAVIRQNSLSASIFILSNVLIWQCLDTKMMALFYFGVTSEFLCREIW